MRFGSVALADGPAESLPVARASARMQSDTFVHSMDLLSRLFVWLVWTTMVLIALTAVVMYSSRIPYMDEWNALVPALTGAQPISLSWLWSPHNEHRIFLPRLVTLGLLKLSGGDFRVGCYFNVAILAVVSACAVRAARIARGRATFADSVFPLLLLHLRHFENIFWILQNQIIISIACSLLALFVAATYTPDVSGLQLLGCGVALLAIPLCGAFALPIAALSSLWLAWVATARYRRVRKDSFALAAAIVASIAVIVCVVYPLGLRRASHEQPSPVAMLRFVANLLGFGMGIPESPWLNYVQETILFTAPLAFVALVTRWFQKPDDRARTAGVGIYFMGAVAILAAIASGRDASLFPSRYGLLCIPIPVTAYFAFLLIERDSKPGKWRSFATSVIFVPALLLSVTSIEPLWNVAKGFMATRAKVDAALEAQVPLPKLLAAYGTDLFPSNEYLFNSMLAMTREHRVPFASYNPNASYTVEPLNLGPASLHAFYWDATGTRHIDCPIAWRDGAATVYTASGATLQIMVQMPGGRPRFLRGARVSYSMDTPAALFSSTGLNLQWMASDGGSQLVSVQQIFDGDRQRPGDPLTFYIDDTVDRLSIVPLGPTRGLTIRRIELFIPATGVRS